MNNIYPITTLRDIYHLPTIEKMEICLEELTEVLLQARRANDAVMAVLKDIGSEGLVRALEWPEVTNWVDDGLSETMIEIGFPTIL